MSETMTLPSAHPKRLAIQRWVSSFFIGGIWLIGGGSNLMHAESSLEVFHGLGYPDYFASLLGAAQVLGASTILLPLRAIPRTLKEWAYAGLVFDAVAANVSLLVTKAPPLHFVFPLLALGIIAANYSAWKERSSTMPTPKAQSSSEP
jgi:hypothetical protein